MSLNVPEQVRPGGDDPSNQKLIHSAYKTCRVKVTMLRSRRPYVGIFLQGVAENSESELYYSDMIPTSSTTEES
jgi:hypothetical protein